MTTKKLDFNNNYKLLLEYKIKTRTWNRHTERYTINL